MHGPFAEIDDLLRMVDRIPRIALPTGIRDRDGKSLAQCFGKTEIPDTVFVVNRCATEAPISLESLVPFRDR